MIMPTASETLVCLSMPTISAKGTKQSRADNSLKAKIQVIISRSSSSISRGSSGLHEEHQLFTYTTLSLSDGSMPKIRYKNVVYARTKTIRGLRHVFTILSGADKNCEFERTSLCNTLGDDLTTDENQRRHQKHSPPFTAFRIDLKKCQ